MSAFDPLRTLARRLQATTGIKAFPTVRLGMLCCVTLLCIIVLTRKPLTELKKTFLTWAHSPANRAWLNVGVGFPWRYHSDLLAVLSRG